MGTRPRCAPRIGVGTQWRRHARVSLRTGALRHPGVGERITCRRPGSGQRIGPRCHPRIGVRASALRGTGITTGIGAPRQSRVRTRVTRLQPGIGQRAAPRPDPRIGVATSLRPRPRISAGTSPLGHPRIGVWPGLRPHPRIGMRTSGLRHPGVGEGITVRVRVPRQPRVRTRVTRLRPGIGRQARLRAGEGAGSWVRRWPAAVAGAAGIIGGRAPPGPGGLLRTSVSHASPLRPAERNPSWPTSAKSLHHAASAGGAAT